MENWQIFVSVCTGIIAFISVLDKVGVLATVKRAESSYNELQALIKQSSDLSESVRLITETQDKQNKALLANLRNHLYRSFRDNRRSESWSDDECRVQTLLHGAYVDLDGNGEEAIWWSQKLNWKVLSEEEIRNRPT